VTTPDKRLGDLLARAPAAEEVGERGAARRVEGMFARATARNAWTKQGRAAIPKGAETLKVDLFPGCECRSPVASERRAELCPSSSR